MVRLHVNTWTKLVLGAIFGLCSGTVVVSALRVWANTVYHMSADPVGHGASSGHRGRATQSHGRLSTELGMLAPHALHAREKNMTHIRNKSRGPRARQEVSETSKAEPWQEYEHTQSLGHVGAREAGTPRDPYASSTRVDDLEHGIVKTVSLGFR
ncbi:MAG: hypothetical protein LQ339_005601 [Xanthoria mediterranea]|nr:MAG: hypothetical protein LQ339_005601 [Xanthoria mediterranea]